MTVVITGIDLYPLGRDRCNVASSIAGKSGVDSLRDLTLMDFQSVSRPRMTRLSH